MGLMDRFRREGAPAETGPGQGAKISYERRSKTPAAPGGVDMAKRAPGLVDLHKKAGVSLEKKGLSGVRAAVYLVLDHSGSMRQFYRNGTVQSFTERVLAAAVHLDDDGVVPVVLFDSVAHEAQKVSVDDYSGAVERVKERAGSMGSTNYAAAIAAVVELHEESGASEPALVVFETDGSPDSRAQAERALCAAASLPIFWQFVGFGNDSFDFLRKLDDLAVPGKRVIDNAGFFAAGSTPAKMDSGAFYDALLGEFPTWLAQARRQGIVV